MSGEPVPKIAYRGEMVGNKKKNRYIHMLDRGQHNSETLQK